MIRREETIRRLGGCGDNWHMSWGADDRQYVSVCDGLGWFKEPQGTYNSRLWTITGGADAPTFGEMSDYPDLISGPTVEEKNRYYNFGTLALDGRIYQFLSTPNHPFCRSDGSVWPDARFVGAKLIYSPDHGRTWCNQDGSTPVAWERWQDRSRQNMVFFEEPQDSFCLLSVLQMGRNYEENRDGYVYVYSPNGSIEGTMNQLVMFRVPKDRVQDRRAYEYFAGRTCTGAAEWTKGVDARAVVLTFPSGWVNHTLHPWAWVPSVTYNAPLGLYMMASWGNGCAPDGSWFAKPSYLGVWVAEHPWGPWNQIHEETAWTPANDPAARVFAPQIAPKWIAPDGKSFWLVWSDYQGAFPQKQEFEQLVREFGISQALVEGFRRLPHYEFNTQRVDLDFG